MVHHPCDSTAIHSHPARVSIASIMRLVAILDVKIATLATTAVSPTNWATVEQGALIVCACLPTLRPLLLCCSRRPRLDSQQSITSLSLQPEAGATAGVQSNNSNIFAKSTTALAPSSQRQSIALEDFTGRPQTAPQVGTAISSLEQEAMALFPDHPICGAILASDPGNVGFNSQGANGGVVPLTPQIAAFQQRTRGLGHSRSNYF